jgi:hypothetical protein
MLPTLQAWRAPPAAPVCGNLSGTTSACPAAPPAAPAPAAPAPAAPALGLPALAAAAPPRAPPSLCGTSAAARAATAAASPAWTAPTQVGVPHLGPRQAPLPCALCPLCPLRYAGTHRYLLFETCLLPCRLALPFRILVPAPEQLVRTCSVGLALAAGSTPDGIDWQSSASTAGANAPARRYYQCIPGSSDSTGGSGTPSSGSCEQVGHLRC